MEKVTKEKLLEAINEIPAENLNDVWLFLEFLTYKEDAKKNAEFRKSDLEGAYPELDMPYEDIESILNQDRTSRQSRL